MKEKNNCMNKICNITYKHGFTHTNLKYHNVYFMLKPRLNLMVVKFENPKLHKDQRFYQSNVSDRQSWGLSISYIRRK